APGGSDTERRYASRANRPRWRKSSRGSGRPRGTGDMSTPEYTEMRDAILVGIRSGSRQCRCPQRRSEMPDTIRFDTPASTLPRPSQAGAAARALGWLLPLLFAASGCAALIYQVVWFQLLSLALGASAISLGVLLATFMGGLCLGSLLLPRLVPAGRHP